MTMTVDEEAVKLVAKEGFDPVYGARPLRRAIQNSVEDAVAEKLLEGTVKSGDAIRVTAEDGKIAIVKEGASAAPAEPAAPAEEKAEH